jgi:hypothetical protein
MGKLTDEEKGSMNALIGKVYGKTVFDKDFEKALNGKPFALKYPPKGEPLNEFFQKHSVIIITNWNNVVKSYWVVGE